ncbi:MAG TPA: Gfo/Idh/MocA family oxidoreductase [Patescibacteria group bacterium]|nr:Gfo/Idh/MocA family oxidoreductase [Patescibacteria group bacterium]
MRKAGIIGMGVGEAHIAGYEAHEGCEVVALCDFSDEKYQYALAKYPHKLVTKNADEILKNPEIDIVSIASFDNFHAKQILTAIAHNKHIFVEKPLCLYPEEAKDIRKALNEKQFLKISSNLILRRAPRFILLKEMIERGELGKLFYVEGDYNYGRLYKLTEGWRGDLDFYSIVLGGTIHLLDLLMWLTDDTISEVSAFGTNIASRGTKFRFNDTVASVVKFESGMVGKFGANFACVTPHFHEVEVYGTKATFKNGKNFATLETTRDPVAEPQKITAAYPGHHKGDLLKNFVDAIMNDEEPEIGREDIFKALSVCFAIDESAREGRNITVAYL